MSNPLDWSLNSLQDSISSTPYALQGMFQGASSFNQKLGFEAVQNGMFQTAQLFLICLMDAANLLMMR